MTQVKVTIPLAVNFECDLGTVGPTATQRSLIRNGYIIRLPDGSAMLKKRPGWQKFTLSHKIEQAFMLPTSGAYLITIGSEGVNTVVRLIRTERESDNTTSLGNANSLGNIGGDNGPATGATSSLIGTTIQGLLSGIGRAYRIDFTFFEPTGVTLLTANAGTVCQAWGVVMLDSIGFRPAAANNILNSNSADLTTWSTLSTIQLPTGAIIAGIAQHHNHIVACSEISTEFFYDAGNPTGSVLSLRKDMSQSVGMRLQQAQGFSGFVAPRLCANFISSYSEKTFFMGGPKSDAGSTTFFTNPNVPGDVSPTFIGNQIFMLDNFIVSKISTPFVENFLQHSVATGKDIGLNGVLCLDGKGFVVVTFDYTNGKCLVYDIEERLWYLWDNLQIKGHISGNFFISDQGGDGLGTATLKYFPTTSAAMTDDSSFYTFSLIAPKIDSVDQASVSQGKIKTADKLRIMGNRSTSSTPISVSFSDDDYQTFIPNGTIDLAKYENLLTNQGSFRERAYKFDYTGSGSVQLNYVTLDVSVGTA